MQIIENTKVKEKLYIGRKDDYAKEKCTKDFSVHKR